MFTLRMDLGSASVLTGIRERRYVPDKLRAGAVALVKQQAPSHKLDSYSIKDYIGYYAHKNSI